MFIWLVVLFWVVFVPTLNWLLLRHILPHPRLIPELGHLYPDSKARARAFTRAISSFHGHAWFVAIWGSCVLFVFAFGGPLGTYVAIKYSSQISMLYHMLTAALLPLVVSYAAVYFMFKDRIRGALREQLAGSPSLSVCVKCGYDLRGSQERCPECGEEFEAA